MELSQITDKKLARLIFTKAFQIKDLNRENYSEKQFEKAWLNYLKFYVCYDDSNIVCFFGIRKFNNKYGRIFDRYFILPEYRSKNLKYENYSSFFIRQLVDDCIKNKLILFFSIQNLKKRKALKIAVKEFNKKLDKDHQFHILDGLYCTVHGEEHKLHSWQNIAIQKPFKIDLKKKR